MNYREKIVARLMLSVALMLTSDPTTRNELRELIREVKQGGEIRLEAVS